MIETLSIRNFKLLRHVDLRLQPLTVIVGPNASGKSSILQALTFLEQMEELRYSRLPFLLSLAVRSYSPALPDSSEISFTGSSGKAAFEISISSAAAGGHNGVVLSPDFDRILKLDAKKLAAPSYPKTVSLNLPGDGEGLSAICASLLLEESDRFRRIVEQLREVIPTVLNLRVGRATLEDGTVGFELLFDTREGDGIPAHAISEGTLLTLGLLTALSAPRAPKLILIDDLERGLHPKALGDLMRQLRRLQKQNSCLQIIATSHSPYLLDFLKPEEILLTSLDEDGYAAVKSLAEHPEYERWKDMMAPGEFWSTVGESWVAEPSKTQSSTE
jgi:predicted ATPase